ncbi:MAG: hypothetical protein HYZ53_22170 [Planctomycetes bacterium]|nr:hypothetical protein [Planctomycetota bacterium]
MRNRRTLPQRLAPLALVLLFFAYAARAQDPAPAPSPAPSTAPLPPALAKAVATYDDAAQGMTDYAVDLKISQTPPKAPPRTLEVRRYWKAPGKLKFVFKTPTGADESEVPGIVVNLVTPLAALRQALEETPNYDFTESLEGELRRLEGKVRKGAPAHLADNLTAWIDATGRIPRLAQLRPGMEVTTTLACEEREGKRLLTSVEERHGKRGVVIAWDYAKVGDRWLVAHEAVRPLEKDHPERGPSEGTVTVEFTNHQVNAGIEDSLFDAK